MSNETISFIDRVKNVAINESKKYKSIYVDYDYLVCSQVFTENDYYIISALEDNYQHLIGINSSLKAKDFFEKCYNGTLEEKDFDFNKKGQSVSAVKGTVRRKIKVLENMMTLFDKTFFVQEQFTKNNIVCNFATADNRCTIGFIDAGKYRPKTLISGNGLDSAKSGKVDLLLRKKAADQKFNEIIIGDVVTIKNYYDNIENVIDESSVISSINKVTFRETGTSIE